MKKRNRNAIEYRNFYHVLYKKPFKSLKIHCFASVIYPKKNYELIILTTSVVLVLNKSCTIWRVTNYISSYLISCLYQHSLYSKITPDTLTDVIICWCFRMFFCFCELFRQLFQSNTNFVQIFIFTYCSIAQSQIYWGLCVTWFVTRSRETFNPPSLRI